MKLLARQLACLSVFAFLGCGSGHATTVKVSGKVLHGGQAVVGASISFVPDGGAGRPASAVSDQSGTYELTTFSAKDGAVPGKYTVVVNPAPKAGAKTAADSAPMTTADDYAAAMGKGADPVAKATSDTEGESDVPSVYQSPATSPLKKEVAASGSNRFDLLVD